MPLNIKAFERAMKKAEEKKKAALSAPTPAPVAAKAPVAPKKEEQPELKSSLTPEEVQYYVNMINEANARSPSHPNNTTNRIIRERLQAMGIQPTSAE